MPKTNHTNYKSYPEYKDSGVTWLGDVPEHWEVKKLKYLVKEKLKYGANESAELDDPSLPRYIRITDFGDDGKLRDDTFKSLPQDKAKEYLLEEGDILFARSGATVGKTFQFKNYNGIACFAGYLIKASPDKDKILSDFVYYYTKSTAYDNWKNSIFIQATIQNIGADKYQTLLVTRPSLDEQKATADFLDRRTGAIDELIAKKKRVIELLKEKRTAIISYAVTKGLNPDVKMKDSGIDWLGEIPEHWEGMSLKRWVKIKITDGPHETPKLVDDGIPFVSAEAVRNGKINFDAIRGYISHDLHKQYIKKCYPRKNDIFMIKSGATTGNLALVDTDCEFSIWSPLALIRANEKKILPKYLFLSLHADYVQNQVQTLWSFGTQQNIGMGIIERLYVIAPSVKEQHIIVSHLDRETSRIDALIAKVTEAIEKLKEYRTALISAAVTGKIDVRECVSC